MKVFDIVKHFCNRVPLEENGNRKNNYTFVIDSFYGSEKLAQDLINQDIAFIMVIKKNSDKSEYYKKMCEKQPSKGDWVASTSEDGVLAILYHYKKEIFVLTNCCTPELVKQKHRYVPEAIDVYNKIMCGVDMVDSAITGRTQKIKVGKKFWLHMYFVWLLTTPGDIGG